MARVAIITDSPAKNGRIFDGGAELLTYQLARVAVDAGVPLTVYQPGESASRTEVRGVQVESVPADAKRIWSAATRKAIADGCQRIHYHYLQHVPASAKGIHATATNHGVYWDIPFQADLASWYPHGQLARLYLPLWRRAQKARYFRALRRCRDVIAEDTSLLRLVQSERPELRDRVTVIPNFFDPDSLSSADGSTVDSDTQRAKDANRLIVLVPRNLTLSKGLAFLPRLAELLWERLGEDFLLVVTGDFLTFYRHHYQVRFQAALQALTPSVRDRIKLLNGLRREQMGAYYRISDVVVIPTFAYEATSLSALEAMSFGKPVVVTNIGGLNEIIDDGVSGVIVRPSPVALADAIGNLAGDPERRAQLGAAGRRRVEQAFSLGTWKERVRRFIETNGWCDERR